MRIGRAFTSGVTGGAVTTLFMAVGRASGVPFSLEALLATLSGGSPGPAEWAGGFLLHLFMSGLMGIVYGAGFEYLTHRAGWRLGLVFSFAHTIAEWSIVALASSVRPLAPELLRLFSPGESAFVGFAVVHALYGVVVGALYAPGPGDFRDAILRPAGPDGEPAAEHEID